MKRIILTLILAAGSLSLSAQQVYRIYDGPAPGTEGLTYPELVLPNAQTGHPMVYNVTEPTITVYKPEKAIDTGAAVIIAPGGGNMYLTWQEEGINVAEWFQRRGITGIILKYRTNFMGNNEEEINKSLMEFFGRMFSFAEMGQERTQGASPAPRVQEQPLQKQEPTIQGDDGRQAVRYVRAHAAELGIDPQKIALMGFSAGGMLTSDVMYINDDESRPNLAAPIYGTSGMGLPEHPVPTFICGPEFDLFPPDNFFALYKEFQAAHLPAELHFITDANHGEGLLYNGKEWNEWIDLLYNFMKAVKFID